jgi:hypothetical protein
VLPTARASQQAARCSARAHPARKLVCPAAERSARDRLQHRRYKGEREDGASSSVTCFSGQTRGSTLLAYQDTRSGRCKGEGHGGMDAVTPTPPQYLRRMQSIPPLPISRPTPSAPPAIGMHLGIPTTVTGGGTPWDCRIGERFPIPIRDSLLDALKLGWCSPSNRCG